MPELPEVETTIRALRTIRNKKIIKIVINTKKLRFSIPKHIKFINNIKISNIRRIAKYIIIDLNNNNSLIFHLGMSGRLRISNKTYYREKHDHVIISFHKNNLIFNDSRRFGFIDIVFTNKLYQKNYISNLGPDALSKNYDKNYIYKKINKSEVPIKQIILNQKILSGIGNIYASEILFDAKISPLTRGKSLNYIQISKLIISIRKILRKAINHGGSSIRDYKSADGTLGNFQSNFKVYNREGLKISNFKIKKIVQYGRSTYYCPKIQNNKI